MHNNPGDQLCKDAGIPKRRSAERRPVLFGSKMLLQRSCDGVFDVSSGNAGALRNILNLVDGSDDVEDVHALQILLQSIKTLAEKGLGRSE